MPPPCHSRSPIRPPPSVLGCGPYYHPILHLGKLRPEIILPSPHGIPAAIDVSLWVISGMLAGGELLFLGDGGTGSLRLQRSAGLSFTRMLSNWIPCRG